MEDYVVIKELIDANVGTRVIWDEEKNCFTYKKSTFISPYDTTYLSAGQVTQTPEYFCKLEHYPEYYAMNHSVFSRREILDLLKEAFPKKTLSGIDYEISASRELHIFDKKLRELGVTNAEKIVNNKTN